MRKLNNQEAMNINGGWTRCKICKRGFPVVSGASASTVWVTQAVV